MDDRGRFLDAAMKIGNRLREWAVWDGDSCTWEVVKPDREKPYTSSVKALADGGVYQGTAGIALFPMELHRQSREEEHRRLALGALRHAVSSASGLPDAGFGFYSARTGIALALARGAEVLRSPLLLREAETVLLPLLGRARDDAMVDVIGGAAGAIPALLETSRLTGETPWRQLAVELGDHLVEIALHEPQGWSWTARRRTAPFYVRRLTGMAHGAAGVGLALAALFDSTGLDRYRFAARQAFGYEEQFFRLEEDNWLDLQHSEIARHMATSDLDGLRERIQSGDRPAPYRERCHTAWCHGAPGIAITRIYAAAVLGDPRYRAQAKRALRCTRKVISTIQDFSLCHGRAGNCEPLIYASGVLGEPRWLEVAEAAGRQGLEEFEDRGVPWPCGTRGGQTDPSLMLGEAGIGYFYLRLASPETPSVLFALEPPAGAAPEPSGPSSSAGKVPERRRYVVRYWRRTLTVLNHLRPGTDDAAEELIEGWEGPGLMDLREKLEARLEAPGDPALSERLQDAYRLDAAVFAASAAPRDFAEQYMDELSRSALPETDVTGLVFERAPTLRLVSTEFDWERWLGSEEGRRPEVPLAGPVHYVVYQAHATVRALRLSRLAFAVLEVLDRPRTGEEVVREISDRVGPDASPDEVTTLVRSQLAEAHDAGLLLVSSPALEPAVVRAE